jgi:hypothetical protein
MVCVLVLWWWVSELLEVTKTALATKSNGILRASSASPTSISLFGHGQDARVRRDVGRGYKRVTGILPLGSSFTGTSTSSWPTIHVQIDSLFNVASCSTDWRTHFRLFIRRAARADERRMG